MSKNKLLAASAIFIMLTAVKLLLPNTAQILRSLLIPRIEQNIDFKTAAIKLGGYLSDGEGMLLSVFTQRNATPETTPTQTPSTTPEPTPEPTPIPPPEPTIAPTPNPTPNPTPPPTPEPTPEPTPDPTPEPTPAHTAEPMEDAVAAFIASQSAYADQAIPANVSYDMPELPFACVNPVSGVNADGFGSRLHPIQNVVKFHYGTDLAAWSGTDIRAFAGGTVRDAGEMTGYGKYVRIDHAEGYTSFYAHCSAVLVTAGESVAMGQTIARVGATGDVTGPHLHFELLKNGNYINPEYYIKSA